MICKGLFYSYSSMKMGFFVSTHFQNCFMCLPSLVDLCQQKMCTQLWTSVIDTSLQQLLRQQVRHFMIFFLTRVLPIMMIRQTVLQRLEFSFEEKGCGLFLFHCLFKSQLVRSCISLKCSTKVMITTTHSMKKSAIHGL